MLIVRHDVIDVVWVWHGARTGNPPGMRVGKEYAEGGPEYTLMYWPIGANRIAGGKGGIVPLLGRDVPAMVAAVAAGMAAGPLLDLLRDEPGVPHEWLDAVSVDLTEYDSD